MHSARTNLLSAALLSMLAVVVAGCSNGNLFDLVGNFWSLGCCGVIVVVLDVLALVELAGSGRSTGSKVLWALLIIFFPVGGCVLYYLFGR